MKVNPNLKSKHLCLRFFFNCICYCESKSKWFCWLLTLGTRKSKLSYTREFLLSLSKFDVCKKLPNGFDASILRYEFHSEIKISECKKYFRQNLGLNCVFFFGQ